MMDALYEEPARGTGGQQHIHQVFGKLCVVMVISIVALSSSSFVGVTNSNQ